MKKIAKAKKTPEKKPKNISVPREGCKRQTVVLPEKLVTKIWMASKSQGQTFSSFIEEAAIDKLKKSKF